MGQGIEAPPRTIPQLPDRHERSRLQRRSRRGDFRWDELVVKPRCTREDLNHDKGNDRRCYTG